MTTYNLTQERVIYLYDKFGGLCWSCQVRPATSVDHDHSCCKVNSCGRCVRGVLCHRCNCAIGKLGDDIEGVRTALAYLERGSEAETLVVASKNVSVFFTGGKWSACLWFKRGQKRVAVRGFGTTEELALERLQANLAKRVSDGFIARSDMELFFPTV